MSLLGPPSELDVSRSVRFAKVLLFAFNSSVLDQGLPKRGNYSRSLQGRSSSVRPGSSNDHTSTQALCLWNEIERYWLQDS